MTAGIVLLLFLGLPSGPTWKLWGPRTRRVWGVQASSSAFLADKLPLRTLVTTPVGLLSGTANPVQLSGSQAITAVFSRPVIALGADFGNEDNYGGKVPFNLTCASSQVPAGKFRWVTTTIARFDPDQVWPTDLDCQFTLNDALTTYDGVPLIISSSSKQLVTQPLSMSLSYVMSEKAQNLTGNLWSASVGMPDDLLPEVPSDGGIVLGFNAPVNLSVLINALQLRPNPNSVSLRVAQCITSAPWVISTVSDVPDISTNVSDSCAVVYLSASLDRTTLYKLVLPEGTIYGHSSSPTTADVSISIAGLRAFRLPFRQDWQQPDSLTGNLWDGTSYRRLNVWLPHGLQSSSQLQGLASQLSLCEIAKPFSKSSSDCRVVPVESTTLPGPGLLQLSVPSLMPRHKYRVTVENMSSVKDGFGLPLDRSTTEFWALDVNPQFQGPTLSGSPVAIFAPGALPRTWPMVAMGSDPNLKSAAVWGMRITTDADALQLINVMNTQSVLVSSVLGEPSNTVERVANTSWHPLDLPLNTTLPVHVVHTCCQTVNYPTQRQISASVVLLLRTDLAAFWTVAAGQQVLVWVTRTSAGTSAGPVAGAKANLYAIRYDASSALVGSCTTGVDGSCSVSKLSLDSSQSTQLVGLVMDPNPSNNGSVVYTPSAGFWSSSSIVDYTGTLVMDRPLLRPADTLNLVGYLAQRGGELAPGGTHASSAGLGLPNVTSAMLTVSPSWDPTQPDNPISLVVPVSPVYGSMRASLLVPANAKMGQYWVGMYISPNNTLSINNSTDNLLVVATEAVTVADPRPPTADLTLTLPPWSGPTSSVNVSLQATSYLGSSVEGASVTIVWNTANAQGLLDLVTDVTGAVSSFIPLDTLPSTNSSHAGDTLQIVATWVGPTREVISRSGSVRLEDTQYRIEVTRNLDTAVPTLPFGCSAKLLSNIDDSVVKDTPIVISLRPNITGDTSCNTSANCTVYSGHSPASCQLALPCMGDFLLEACTVPAQGKEATCNSFPVGRNRSAWAASPLSAQDEPELSLNASTFLLGSTAGIEWQNPWSNTSAMILWGNSVSLSMSRKLLPTVLKGLVQVPLLLGPECQGGCSVMVLLSVPATSNKPTYAGVPVSRLYDPAAASVHVLQTSVTVIEARELNVSLGIVPADTAPDSEASVATVQPGATATITVTCTTPDGKPAADVEVVVVAVDKAVLDLLPYALPSLSSQVLLNLVPSLYSGSDMDTSRVASGALHAVFSTLMRRLTVDPWLPIDTTISPGNYFSNGNWGSQLAAVDMNDTAYLAQFTTAISYLPPTFRSSGSIFAAYAATAGSTNFMGAIPEAFSSGAANFAGAADSVQAATSPSPSSAAQPSLRVSSLFQTTPLFTSTITRADGTGDVTFTAPENLGRFVVRAYAVSRGVAGLGQAESAVVVVRKLSLTASQPRIVRTGDVFLAGVLVTAPGATPSSPAFNVVVTVTVVGESGPLALLSSSNSTTLTLGAGSNQQEARFNFSAVALGTATLRFAVTDNAGAADALESSIPVLSVQPAVFLATSLALRPANGSGGGNASGDWQEGLELPDAMPGSGTLQLTAGVGYLPALTAAVSAVAQRSASMLIAFDLDAVTCLPLVTIAPALAAYSQPLSAEYRGNANVSMAMLVTLTDSDLGLLPGLPTNGWTPYRADVALNGQAAWLLRQYAYSDESEPALSAAWLNLVQNQMPIWLIAAARQLVTDATASRNPPAGVKPGSYSDLFTLAWARLALGADWVVPSCGTPDAVTFGGVCTNDEIIRQDLGAARLLKNATDFGLATALVTALGIQEVGVTPQTEGFLNSTADLLISSIRVQGRTAYISSSPSAKSAAPLDTQALALLLLTQMQRPDVASLVQKLAAYVGSSGAQGGSNIFSSMLPPVWVSSWAVALQVKALSAYDVLAGSATADLQLAARVDDVVVLEASFNASTLLTQPTVNSSTPWEKLASPPGPLSLNVQGSGEASLSVALSFVPARPLDFPSYRGLWVSSVLQVIDPLSGDAVGPPLSAAPMGSLLQLTVQLVSPDDLEAVTVEVPMPGGLEPIDPLLPATTSSSSGASSASIGFVGRVAAVSGRGNIWGGGCALGDLGAALGQRFWSWWWPVCPVQETQPQVVTWRWQRLMAGSQTLTVMVVAATEGTFQVAPIKAYADSQPEVSGMTANSRFTVCEPGCLPVPTGPPGIAVGCPGECSGNGACNTRTGVCVCASSWSGVDCSEQASK